MLERVSTTLAPFLAFLAAMAWISLVARRAADSRRIERQTGLKTIRELDWREFERLLAEAFRRLGHRVRLTEPGADGGVDLILDEGRAPTLVQAKHWKKKKVGVDKVRELRGVCAAWPAARGILVTSGTATMEAHRWANENGIELVEGPELTQLIREVQRPHAAVKLADPEPQRSGQHPDCPRCGTVMVKRIAKKGPRPAEQFWGCPTFPRCWGTREVA